MGYHNQQHRRVAAAKNRRLVDGVDEEELLKSLIARFSPTQIYTETLTDVLPPTDTPSADETPSPTPTPPPVTSSPPPETTSNPIPETNTNTDTNTGINTDTTATASTIANTDTDTDTNINTDTDTSTIPPVPITTETTAPATSPTAVSPVITSPPVAPSSTSRTVSAPPSTLTKTNIATAPSPTSSAEPAGSGTNVGGIIGGLAAGLIGLTVVVFAVRYFLRRRARKNEETGGFSPSEFRSSAVLINDPPTHNDTIERGYNPRPPSMVERRLASPPPAFGAQYGATGSYGTEYGNMDQYGQFQSFTPGQFMNNMSAPPSANSANPLYAEYGQSPFSPVSAMGPYGSGYGDQAAASPYLTRQQSTGTQLTRQSSLSRSYPNDGQAQYANYPGSQQVASQGDYVDLDRSSVTPFQAAQYAEISKKLNTEVPTGLDTPAVTNFVQGAGAPPVPAISPFADPVSPDQQRRSIDSVTHDLQNFPAPPSPVPTSHSRVDSTPPTLPEIQLESRVTSYDLTSPLGSAFPSGVTVAGKGFAPAPSPLVSQFPATPSPMASSFDIQSPHAAESSFPAAAPVAAKKETEQKKRPDTVYDDDDAYGGF